MIDIKAYYRFFPKRKNSAHQRERFIRTEIIYDVYFIHYTQKKNIILGKRTILSFREKTVISKSEMYLF